MNRDCSQKRVLYVDHFPDIGGGQTSLLTRLDHLDTSVWYPIVAVPTLDGELHDKLSERDVEVVTVPFNRGDIRTKNEKGIMKQPAAIAANIPTVFRATRSLYRLIQNKNIDIIHANSFKSAVLVSLPAHITKTQLIFHAHSRRASTDHGVLGDYVCRSADRIIANSEFTATAYEKWNGKTTVIYPGINTDPFNPEDANPETIRKNCGLKPDQPIIGTVGRLTPNKRQIDLIQALPEIRESYPNTQVLFVGGSYKGIGGDYERQIRKKIRNLGVEDAITFTGHVDDVQNYLAAFDISVLPSLEEPFGRVVVESLLMETPVVGTANGGVTEIITHGETGYLIPPEEPRAIADAVTRLLNNPSRAQKFGKRGRKSVLEQFDAMSITEQEQTLYQSLMN